VKSLFFTNIRNIKMLDRMQLITTKSLMMIWTITKVLSKKMNSRLESFYFMIKYEKLIVYRMTIVAITC